MSVPPPQRDSRVERLAEVICEARSVDPKSHWWELIDDGEKEMYRRMAVAALDALQLMPEWGWDVAGRKKPNPRRIYSGDGRPATAQPNSADYGQLYQRSVSPWVRVEELS